MNGKDLVKNTLDQIPHPKADAKQIVGLVKQGGRVTGYKLSDNTIVQKPQAVAMAKQGEIKGVAIAHRGDNEYLKDYYASILRKDVSIDEFNYFRFDGDDFSFSDMKQYLVIKSSG